jgi:hypothetical protein
MQVLALIAVAKQYYLLRFKAVQPMFRKNLLPPSSQSKSKLSKEISKKQVAYSYRHYSDLGEVGKIKMDLK